MTRIEFPKPLKRLLEDSELQAPIRTLADRVGEILSDNKLLFFPDYTDHGPDHVNRVLRSEVELIPKGVWKNSTNDSDPRLLCDADAAVIIAATLLHDIAMHLRPPGFLQLVSRDSRFKPLPWFSANQEGHLADQPWHELWQNYLREARRFSDRDLTNIIGEQSAREWKFHELPADIGQWETNHYRIIGEFIRRHHARLAHEIAIYGFPGLEVGSGRRHFPAMGTEQSHALGHLADLIGLTARSHGVSLRLCKAYLDASPLHQGTPRPMGTAVLYPMALLRVADYLQIDRKRAPAVLLQLRNPQSPISVREWSKHLAVLNISQADDPRARMVQVNPGLSLELYLQLRDLIDGLQAEIDHSTAVLDEAYGIRDKDGLDQLNLAIRRVRSSLDNPSFRDGLPYIPEPTGFAADPHLLTLLVEPLYGKKPGVGVRELIQNAVDAVCELEAWCQTHNVRLDSLDLPEQEADVLVDFIKRDDGSWYLRVSDRGIGMTADTIQNYFLRAGASYRRSPQWARDFIDEQDHPRVIRAGRFGIGAFAVFLLGPSFELHTRHVTADKSTGCTIRASANSQLIEITRCGDLPIGTTIEVELSTDTIEYLELEEVSHSSHAEPGDAVDWFCWDWPTVVKRVFCRRKPIVLHQEYACPIRKTRLPPEWSVIHPDGFDAVSWTFGDAPFLSCNGLRVARIESYWKDDFDLFWEEECLHAPRVAVIDKAANLPLTVQRYALSHGLPFIDELVRDVMLSFIAHGLVCGPTSPEEALRSDRRYPLQRAHSVYRKPEGTFSDGNLRWCTTSTHMVPVDPWLYSLLKAGSCLVFGVLVTPTLYRTCGPKSLNANVLLQYLGANNCAAMQWLTVMESHGTGKYADWPSRILAELALQGVSALDHVVQASRVLVSSDPEFRFSNSVLRCLRAPKSGNANPTLQCAAWRKVGSRRSGSRSFGAGTGTLASVIPLRSTLESFSVPPSGVVFVSELAMKRVERTPESLIARVWNECLGSNAIPFDPAARKDMIAKACEHPELKRHIDAWQEMKRTGSKWVTGKQD